MDSTKQPSVHWNMGTSDAANGVHMKDPYEVLQVERTATAEAVKLAYRKLALKYHPVWCLPPASCRLIRLEKVYQAVDSRAMSVPAPTRRTRIKALPRRRLPSDSRRLPQRTASYQILRSAASTTREALTTCSPQTSKWR